MRAMILTASLLATLAVPVSAHEKGAIYLTSKTVPAGGELAFRGERLPKNGTVRMQLRGTLETFNLPDIRIDSAGRFQGKLPLPAGARAGSYAVIAVASDGEVVARADLVVSAAQTQAPAAMPGTMPGMDHSNMPGMGDSAAPHATADMMDVPVNTSRGEWALIAALIGLSAAGGFVLLARAGRAA